MVDMVKEPLDVRFHYPVVVPELKLDREPIHGIQCPNVGPIAIAAAQKLLLIDGL
jgi:hypothetical protein